MSDGDFLYYLVWFNGLFNSFAGVWTENKWLWLMGIVIMGVNLLGFISGRGNR